MFYFSTCPYLRYKTKHIPSSLLHITSFFMNTIWTSKFILLISYYILALKQIMWHLPSASFHLNFAAFNIIVNSANCILAVSNPLLIPLTSFFILSDCLFITAHFASDFPFGFTEVKSSSTTVTLVKFSPGFCGRWFLLLWEVDFYFFYFPFLLNLLV